MARHSLVNDAGRPDSQAKAVATRCSSALDYRTFLKQAKHLLCEAPLHVLDVIEFLNSFAYGVKVFRSRPVSDLHFIVTITIATIAATKMTNVARRGRSHTMQHVPQFYPRYTVPHVYLGRNTCAGGRRKVELCLLTTQTADETDNMLRPGELCELDYIQRPFSVSDKRLSTCGAVYQIARYSDHARLLFRRFSVSDKRLSTCDAVYQIAHYSDHARLLFRRFSVFDKRLSTCDAVYQIAHYSDHARLLFRLFSVFDKRLSTCDAVYQIAHYSDHARLLFRRFSVSDTRLSTCGAVYQIAHYSDHARLLFRRFSVFDKRLSTCGAVYQIAH
ncbi:hypothetical protein J6590_015105 [Homalodisca vitripennis]|nr:hypothetical protein J6590_015105 [Homalodisca vitripennis]